MASPYDSTPGASASGASASNPVPETYLDQSEATILAVFLGILGIGAFFGSIGLVLGIVSASVPTALWLYAAAVSWEYNSSKVAKDGLTLGELLMTLLGPINTALRVLKIRKLQNRLNDANTQAAARDNKESTLLSEKPAKVVGYVLYGVLAYSVYQAVVNGLGILWMIILLLVCVYVLGMALTYIGLDVRKDGLDSSEVKLLVWWPGLIGKSIDEMRGMVNTTTVPNQRPASS